jgi:hypothetical protein
VFFFPFDCCITASGNLKWFVVFISFGLLRFSLENISYYSSTYTSCQVGYGTPRFWLPLNHICFYYGNRCSYIVIRSLRAHHIYIAVCLGETRQQGWIGSNFQLKASTHERSPASAHRRSPFFRHGPSFVASASHSVKPFSKGDIYILHSYLTQCYKFFG